MSESNESSGCATLVLRSETTNQPRPALALRVSGGPRDGQLIRLAAAKCTIGAARGCTLRLRGDDVRPVHCLIVRGKVNTVVRRWSPDTLLNGLAFEDRILAAGDLLRCGPVEFEVVDESDASRTQPICRATFSPAPADLPVGMTQKLPILGRLAASPPIDYEGSMTVPIANIRSLIRHPQGEPVEHDADGRDAERPETDVAQHAAVEAAKQLASREAELSGRETQLAERASSVDERERTIADREAKLAQREQAVSAAEETRAMRLPDLTSPTESEADTWAHERQTLTEALALAEETRIRERETWRHERAALEAERTARAAVHAEWEQQRAAWEAMRKAADSQTEAMHEQVEHHLAEILRRRKTLDQDRATWQAESEQNRKQIEDRAAEVARQSAEIEEWRRDLENQRQEAARLVAETSQYERLRSELAEQHQQLAARERELAEREAALATLQQASPSNVDHAASAHAALREREQKLDEQWTVLHEQADELVRLRLEFERERTAWQRDRTADTTNGTGDEAVIVAQEAEATEEPTSSDSQADTEALSQSSSQTASDERPENGLSTWALFKDQLEREPEPAAAVAPRSVPRSTPPGGAARGQAAPAHDDEESIEQYMRNLLQRVGGRAEDGSSAATNAASQAPKSASTASGAKPQSVTGTAATDADAQSAADRRATPRKTVATPPTDLAAMREIANLNTRVAIDRYGSRRIVSNLAGKACIGAVAVALAIGLAAVTRLENTSTKLVAATCGIIGVGFLAHALKMASQVRRQRRALLGRSDEGRPLVEIAPLPEVRPMEADQVKQHESSPTSS